MNDRTAVDEARWIPRMDSNPCLILEWSDAWSEWPGLFSGQVQKAEPLRIPVERRPAILQPDRETAEAEAKRLAAQHPGKHFAVFGAQVVGITVDVPSHITVSGKVWQTHRVPAVLAIDDSEIPF